MFLLVTIYPWTYPWNIKDKNDENKNPRLEEKEDCASESIYTIYITRSEILHTCAHVHAALNI